MWVEHHFIVTDYEPSIESKWIKTIKYNNIS